MPLVTVKAFEGRTVEQKRALVKHITEAAVNDFITEPGAVHVDIIEYSKDNVAVAGQLYIDR